MSVDRRLESFMSGFPDDAHPMAVTVGTVGALRALARLALDPLRGLLQLQRALLLEVPGGVVEALRLRLAEPQERLMSRISGTLIISLPETESAAPAVAEKKKRPRGEGQFLCPVQGCDKRYGSLGSLANHRQEAHPECVRPRGPPTDAPSGTPPPGTGLGRSERAAHRRHPHRQDHAAGGRLWICHRRAELCAQQPPDRS